MKVSRYLPLILLLLSACQKIDLAEGGEENGSSLTVEQLPIGVGEGSAKRPWTVSQVQLGEMADDAEGWVIGYAVGTTQQTMHNAEFSATTSIISNVLLSADSLCTNPALCLPVELKSDKIRLLCAIPNNRSFFRQCLIVHGRVNTYFRVRGLRSADAAKWLDNFDIQSIDPKPQDWKDTTIIRK